MKKAAIFGLLCIGLALLVNGCGGSPNSPPPPLCDDIEATDVQVYPAKSSWNNPIDNSITLTCYNKSNLWYENVKYIFEARETYPGSGYFFQKIVTGISIPPKTSVSITVSGWYPVPREYSVMGKAEYGVPNPTNNSKTILIQIKNSSGTYHILPFPFK